MEDEAEIKSSRTKQKPRGVRPKVPGGGGHTLAGRQLCDDRFVYKRPEGANESGGRKAARKLLAEDPKAFMVQLERMENQHRESNLRVAEKEREGKGSDHTVETDGGSERAVELIERLLQEWEAGA